MMGAGGWMWGPLILAHLGLSARPAPPDGMQAAIWRRLPEFTDYTPATQPEAIRSSPTQRVSGLAACWPAFLKRAKAKRITRRL